MRKPSLLNTLMDRLILPGAAGFTRFGYTCRKRQWAPLEATLEGRTIRARIKTRGKFTAQPERLGGAPPGTAQTGEQVLPL